MESVEAVREAIARWRRTSAQRFVDELRGVDEPTPIAWPRQPLALREVADDMLPGEAPAAAAHLARAAFERSYAPARARLGRWLVTPLAVGRDVVTPHRALGEGWSGHSGRAPALFRAIDRASSSLAGTLIGARRAAWRAAAELWARLEQPRHADAGPDAADRVRLAETWLRDTDALVSDLVRGGDLHALARQLRWPAMDGAFPPRERFRRAGARWAELDLERELARAVRVEPPHREGHPEARVVVRHPGHDLRLAPAAMELGWQSEVAAARAVGRALAHALVGPLPAPLAFAPVGSVARALGELGAQVLAEPLTSRRAGLGRAESAELRRRFGLRLLLETRWCSAAIVVGARAAAPEALTEISVQAAERALGVPVPAALATLALASNAAPRLRASLGALRLWSGLRERWDEDWYRNPRASEAIREACGRGGALSIEEWCAELDAPEPLPRLLELL